MREHRVEPRQEANEAVRLTWTDERGLSRWIRGRCVSISRSGCQVEVSEKLAERLPITFELTERDARGAATVRYCRPYKLKFRLGLEFSWGEKLKLDLPG